MRPGRRHFHPHRPMRHARRAMRWLGPPPLMMFPMVGPPPPHHPPPHGEPASDPARTTETRLIPSLPSQCPSCGRGLTMDSVDWNGPMSASCPACGSGIKVTWTEL